MITESKLLHPLNTLFRREIRDDGRLIFFNEVQFIKAAKLIDVIVEGRFIVIRLVELLNAFIQIVVTDEGIFIEVRVEQL